VKVTTSEVSDGVTRDLPESLTTSTQWSAWCDNPFKAIKAAADARGTPADYERALDVLRASAEWENFDLENYLDDVLQEIGGETNIVCQYDGDKATGLRYRAAYDDAPIAEEASKLPAEPIPNAQWSPSTGAMTDAQYSTRGGCHCPSCGSSAGISGGQLEVDGGTAWQRVECSECEASWSDTYTLTGYSDLEGGIYSEAVESVVEDVKDRRSKYGFSVDGEARAREVVSESCDLLDIELSEAEIKIAVLALVS
jgi:hypothetical protein